MRRLFPCRHEGRWYWLRDKRGNYRIFVHPRCIKCGEWIREEHDGPLRGERQDANGPRR